MRAAAIGRSIVLTLPGVVGILLISLIFATPVEAAAFTVNRTDDLPDVIAAGVCDVDIVTAGDQCTLRAAIQAANNSGAGPHTITLPAGTYTLTRIGSDDTALNGDLDITSQITITGEGAATTIVQASPTSAATAVDRVFEVRESGSLTLTGVTVRHGKPTAGDGGGGIRAAGDLNLDKVVVTANAADEGGGLLSAAR